MSDDFPFGYDYADHGTCDHLAEDGSENDDWGCLFPDKCIMPDPHMKCECHTAEDAAEYQEAMQKEHPESPKLDDCDFDPNDPFYGF